MKDYIKGTFKKIIFKSDQNYIIGLFKVSDTNTADLEEYIGSTITFTGYFHELTIDEKYMFYGELVDNPKYGLQYKVNEYERVKPEGKDAIIDFLSSDLFPGVGEKSAKQIVNTLGDETLNLIMEDYSNLLLVPNMKEAKAKNIHDILSKYNESYDTIIYLTSIGFSMKDSMLIYNNYKEMTKYIIEEDVYALIDDIDEINFAKIELVRKNLNISDLDGRRIMALVIYVMNDLCFKNGDTFLYFDEIYDGVIKLLDYEFSKDEFYDILIEIANTGKIKIEENEYYLKEYFDSENNIANTIYHLTNKNDTKYKKIEKEIESLENYFDVSYNEKQILAIKNAYEKNFSIITGGPGTGKTTIIKTLIDIYKIHGKKVVLCAPTGRAAKRITETTGEEAKTLHRLLEIGKIEDDFKNVNNNNITPIDADVIVVDEISMVDMFLMNYLLKAVYLGTKLVLVGDADQLPSVGPGNILKNIIESDTIETIHLNEIFRQAAKSKIILNAHRVNEGNQFIKANESEDELKQDFFYINENSQEKMLYELVSLCKGRLQNYGNYNFFDNIQILTPTKKGMLGTKELNKVLQKELNPSVVGKREKKSGEIIFREGDRVMQTKNNYDLYWEKQEENGTGIFNGELGRIQKVNEEEKKIRVKFDDGKTAWYLYSDLDQLEHAYSITIHKSQGSEFDVVIIAIPPAYPMLLTRNLLYTSITRAKELLIIIGSNRTIDYMINNDNNKNRNTGLAYKLMQLGGQEGYE